MVVFLSTVFKFALLMVVEKLLESVQLRHIMLNKVSVESVFSEFSGNADNIFSLNMSSPQISTFITGTSKLLLNNNVRK